MKKVFIIVAVLIAVIVVIDMYIEGYRFVDDGDNSYIKVDVAYLADKENTNGMYFSSVEAMVEKIKAGGFTREQLQTIARFPRDDNGNVKVFDLNAVPEITFPQEIKIKRVEWLGNSYRYHLIFRHQHCGIGHKFLDQSEYLEKVQEIQNGIQTGDIADKLKKDSVYNRFDEMLRNESIENSFAFRDSEGIVNWGYTLSSGLKEVTYVERYQGEHLGAEFLGAYVLCWDYDRFAIFNITNNPPKFTVEDILAFGIKS